MYKHITFIYENIENFSAIKYAAKLLLEPFAVDIEFYHIKDFKQSQHFTIYYGNLNNSFSIKSDLNIQESVFFNQFYKYKILPEIIINSKTNIPILFSPDEPSISKNNNKLEVNQDIIASTFFWASRYEEICTTERDQHNRFLAKSSIALKNNIINIPIVDEYSLLLNTWFKLCNFYLERKRLDNDCDFIICPTHDIDTVTNGRFESIYHELKKISNKPAKRILNLTKLSASFLNRDTYWTFNKIIEIEKKHSATSTFYFLSKTRNPNDADYNFNSKSFKSVFKNIKMNKSDIGLHASYNSLFEKDMILSEKTSLEKAADISIKSTRHHFLRMDIHNVWMHHIKSGLSIDTTLGYAEVPGFRAGLTRPFHPYDFKNESEYSILEIPLVIMDGTFSHYLKISPQKAWDFILPVLEQVKRHYGIASILWHNTFFTDYKFAGYKELYEKILDWVNNNNGKNMSIEQAANIWTKQ